MVTTSYSHVNLVFQISQGQSVNLDRTEGLIEDLAKGATKQNA